jgi:hypothetical protein
VGRQGNRQPTTNDLRPTPTPVGYCIGNDQYFKRDDVGIIYQLNVVPERRRGLIGATLIQAMFDRAAWGCRLFCCWCAQDIEANRFWESLGFVPLAFRTGSRTHARARVHIFWQKRIRAGDEVTPWWFPSQTTSGSIREDRLVFPIPPGVHWSDEMPRVLPSEEKDEGGKMKDESQRRGMRDERRSGEDEGEAKRLPRARERKLARPAIPTGPRGALTGFSFAPPPQPRPQKAQRERKRAIKNDPRLIAAARELRDRWLERVNSGAHLLQGAGKYEVSRRLAVPVESNNESASRPAMAEISPRRLLAA